MKCIHYMSLNGEEQASYLHPPRLRRRYFIQNVTASLALPCLGSRHGIHREILSMSARSACYHGPRLMEAIIRAPMLDYLTLTFDKRNFEEKNSWADELFRLLRREVDQEFIYYGIWQDHEGKRNLHLNCCISCQIPDEWLDKDDKLLERYWPWDSRVLAITQGDPKTPACLSAYFLRFNYPTYLHQQQNQSRDRIQVAKLPKGKVNKMLESLLSGKFKPDQHYYWLDYWLKKMSDREAEKTKSVEKLAIKLHGCRGKSMGKDHREAHISPPRPARQATTI